MFYTKGQAGRCTPQILAGPHCLCKAKHLSYTTTIPLVCYSNLVFLLSASSPLAKKQVTGSRWCTFLLPNFLCIQLSFFFHLKTGNLSKSKRIITTYPLHLRYYHLCIDNQKWRHSLTKLVRQFHHSHSLPTTPYQVRSLLNIKNCLCYFYFKI